MHATTNHHIMNHHTGPTSCISSFATFVPQRNDSTSCCSCSIAKGTKNIPSPLITCLDLLIRFSPLLLRHLPSTPSIPPFPTDHNFINHKSSCVFSRSFSGCATNHQEIWSTSKRSVLRQSVRMGTSRS